MADSKGKGEHWATGDILDCANNFKFLVYFIKIVFNSHNL